jgi:hypothetical protein
MKSNSNGIRNGDNGNKNPVSNWCGTKHNAYEIIILNLKEDISNNIQNMGDGTV